MCLRVRASAPARQGEGTCVYEHMRESVSFTKYQSIYDQIEAFFKGPKKAATVYCVTLFAPFLTDHLPPFMCVADTVGGLPMSILSLSSEPLFCFRNFYLGYG